MATSGITISWTASLYKLFIVAKVISTMESLALWKATFQLLFHKSHLLKIQLMFGFRPEVPSLCQQLAPRLCNMTFVASFYSLEKCNTKSL